MHKGRFCDWQEAVIAERLLWSSGLLVFISQIDDTLLLLLSSFSNMEPVRILGVWLGVLLAIEVHYVHTYKTAKHTAC